MDDTPEVIAELVGNGFFDLGMTSEGKMVYRLSENAAEISPEYFAIMKNVMAQELFEYAKMGLVDLRYNDDLELEYRYTELGREYLDRMGLNPDDPPS